MTALLRLAAAVTLLSLAGVHAQLAVGDRIEQPELEGFTDIAAKSAADLTGRAVLYEFFAFW